MVRRGRPGLGARAATIGPSDKIYAPPRASKRSISVVTLGGSTQREVDHFVMAITSDAAVIRHTAPHLAQMAHGESRSVFPISVNGITRWTDRDGRSYLCGTRDDPSRVGLNHRLLIQGNKMSNLSFFIVLAALLLFPGPTPAAETEPIAALCARPGLQALREAQEEMTVRDTAAATGIKESTLRQLLKRLPKEGRMCGE